MAHFEGVTQDISVPPSPPAGNMSPLRDARISFRERGGKLHERETFNFANTAVDPEEYHIVKRAGVLNMVYLVLNPVGGKVDKGWAFWA
jgi:hypothetical protein